MANLPTRASAAPRTDLGEHGFMLAGTAPFLKCIRDASLTWTTSQPVALSAGSGMSTVNESIFLLQKGQFHLSPFQPVELRITFKSPVYLLTTEKLFEVLCRRYNLLIKLYSKWEINIWPLFLEYFLENGRWPDTIDCMREFGMQIVANFRENGTPQLRRLSRLRRLRKEIPIVLMTRLNVESTIREWTKKHWATVYRKFFNSPSFAEMEANALVMKTLKDQNNGLIALKSVAKQDDLAFAMPFELAAADLLECKSTVGIARMDGPVAPSHPKVVTSIQFSEVCVGPVALPVAFHAERLQVPLISGSKRAYGASMSAPIIAKGMNVGGRIGSNQPKVDRRLKTVFLNFIFSHREPAIWENPADLLLQLKGDEA